VALNLGVDLLLMMFKIHRAPIPHLPVHQSPILTPNNSPKPKPLPLQVALSLGVDLLLMMFEIHMAVTGIFGMNLTRQVTREGQV